MHLKAWNGRKFSPIFRKSLTKKLLFASFSFIGLLVIASFNLPSPKMESCFNHLSNKTGKTSSKSICARLKPITFLEKAEVREVSGAFMKESETERNKYEFLQQPRSIVSRKFECGDKQYMTKWNMIFMVKSAVKNIERRMAIRKSWGSVKFLNFVRFEVVFIVGTTDDKVVQTQLEKENEVYNDLLQANIEDMAKTVPEKVLAGMQWSADNLPDHWIYSSIDDDIVVHLANLIDFLNTLYIPEVETPDIRACYEDSPLVCVYSYQARDIPARDPTSKWYMSNTVYPNEYWPKYCRGGMYVMPVKMVDEMYKVSRRTEYLYLDDVWITGFMRRKLGEGDCNIMPAPNSERGDRFLTGDWWNWNPLLHHFWGNTDLSPIDIVSEMNNKWQSWKHSMKTLSRCINKVTDI